MTQIRLSVSTWNCLADCYIDYSLGEHVGEFEARKVLCRKVLSSMDSDILLMQEVDHWEDFYQPLLHELGFHCSYYQRPGRKDGLVIAAKTSKRLSLMEVEYVSFDDLIERYDDVLFSKQNVGLICRYKHTDEAGEELGRFVIATTHLHWNPARREVKLAQVQVCIYVM
jgi:mRNA deadenylase 3'-5' endonuclease subunit Ccr4